MTSEHWRNIEMLYESAVSLGPVERQQFLANIADLSLRGEIESLLDMEVAAQTF